MSMKTVTIVIISDDVLNGEDINDGSKFLIKELNSLQYQVVKVTVLPESENNIIYEITELQKTTDIIIIVVGGVKFTVIYSALAKALSNDLYSSDKLNQLLNKTKESYDSSEIFIPNHAKILSNNHTPPVIHIQRIFVLKMKHVEKSFTKILKHHLAEYKKERIFEKTIQISLNPDSNAVDLTQFNRQLLNNVKIEIIKNENFIIFKLSSFCLTHIVDLQQKIENTFSNMPIVSFVANPTIWDSIYGSSERHVRNAIEYVESCFKKYGPEKVFISFNGGKDCTVLLHLIITVINKKFPHHTKPLFCLYVQSEDAFPEQESFINNCQAYYNLELFTVKSGIKNALEQTLTKYPHYKACLMGTRRTDPFSMNMNNFQMTDTEWPQIMRVNPLLDWHYSDIWDYLLYYKVPYCSLYDEGYTSLGNQKNTSPNPFLLFEEPVEKKKYYLPAYKLTDESKEREGRN